jgi:hypothetical protein
VQRQDGQLGLLQFNGALIKGVHSIDAGIFAPDLVAFSPNGTSAALFSAGLNIIQVIIDLDGSPRTKYQLDLSGIAGFHTVAVSEDGAGLILLTEEGSVYFLLNAGTPQLIYNADPTSGISFLPSVLNSAIIVDGSKGKAVLVANLSDVPATQIVTENLDLSDSQTMVQTSSDGRSVFVATKGGGSAYRVDAITGDVEALILPVASSRLDRVLNGEAFTISAEDGLSVWFLVKDNTPLRTVFAAPMAPAPSKQQDDTPQSLVGANE